MMMIMILEFWTVGSQHKGEGEENPPSIGKKRGEKEECKKLEFKVFSGSKERRGKRQDDLTPPPPSFFLLFLSRGKSG